MKSYYSGNYLLCILTVLFLAVSKCCAVCYRKPQGASGDRSPVDENFQILISNGNPTTFIPGQQYNLSLSCSNGMKFISFTMIVEEESTSPLTTSLDYDMLGKFEIIDVAETKFSSLCDNMIESTNTNAKQRVDVAWIAPTNPEAGCVLFKAAVLQHRDVWFIDDGFLTKRLCPEEIDEINSQTPMVNPCCACDEAKYEIILERKWMRNTHAKDFPSEAFRTRLGEIIGASHLPDYRFWEYGAKASQGLQDLAEYGATTSLENEIKQNTGTSIRTIIKAPGIPYKHNTIARTLATARVDPSHHLISLVSKIDPSPDWILGVSGLELCLANCTWIEKKILNLYPWDAGTDAGASYMSHDQPQVPPDVVRRITSSFPSDYRSPFFDESGAPMKPLATLHVIRKRIYERDCEFDDEPGPMECSTHPWNSWSECSAKCGPGSQYRIRSYKDSKLAESFDCKMILRQNQNCVGNQCGGTATGIGPIGETNAECELSQWGVWSKCSKRCGRGFQKRTREYINLYASDKCQRGVPIDLEQTKSCEGEDCGGSIFNSEYDNVNDNRNRMTFKTETESSLFDQNIRRPNYSGARKGTANQFDAFDNFNNLKTDSNIPFAEEKQEPQNVEQIYGSEKLTGVNPRKSSLFGDLDFTNTYQSENNNYQRNQYGQRQKQTFYDNNNLNTNANRMQNNQNRKANRLGHDTAAGEVYDELGNKMITVNSNRPSKYNVVQDYCFLKPVALRNRCNTKRVIVKNYWFYDSDDHQCKIFTADNCDENKNKFRTLESCEGTCLIPLENSENMDNSRINNRNNWESITYDKSTNPTQRRKNQNQIYY